MMRILGLALLVPVLVASLWIAVMSLLMLIVGALSALVGAWAFPQVFEDLSDLLFGRQVPAWQIGAMLGFVGSFFRPLVNRPIKMPGVKEV